MSLLSLLLVCCRRVDGSRADTDLVYPLAFRGYGMTNWLYFSLLRDSLRSDNDFGNSLAERGIALVCTYANRIALLFYKLSVLYSIHDFYFFSTP